MDVSEPQASVARRPGGDAAKRQSSRESGGAGVGGLESAARTGAATTRFSCFDGLRAIAATTVLVTHVSLVSGANTNHSFGAYFARMDVGVTIFFVISGFLLYRPFVAALLAGAPRPSARAYARRRLLRIFPAYWVALTAALVLLGGSYEIDQLVRFYALVHIYTAETVLAPIIQAWSLGTELSFYVFLPLFAALLARHDPGTPRGRLRRQVIGLGALVVVALAYRLVVLAADPEPLAMFLMWLPNHLDTFAIGMGLAVLQVWRSQHQATAPNPLDRRWAPALCWGGAAAAFWAVATQVGLPVASLTYTDGQVLWRHLLYTATAALLLLPAIFGPQEQGIIRRLLRLRVVALVGLVSYGVYLWQITVLEEYLDRTGTAAFTGSFLPILTWVFAITVLVAAVSYAVVERPALALKQRRRRPVPELVG
ncbi:acyltransferase [soil metagenome]